MGNVESGHQNNSDGEEESYNYHQRVLKEGSTPVKGSRVEHLRETPESSNDGFVDAQEDIAEEDEQPEDNDNNSASFTGSEGSYTGSSQSGSGSMDRSAESYASNSDHSSHDRSHDQSHDLSGSVSSPDKSDRLLIESGTSSGSLPNRIRVIDTSDSEGEDETEAVSSSSNPRKHLDFSDNNKDKHRHHKHLPRPIPVHKPPAGSARSQGIMGDDEIRGRSQQVKRKADDMEPEDEGSVCQMSVPVKKTGGAHRPFARKRELRDIVLGRQTSSDTDPGTSRSQIPDDSIPGTSNSQVSGLCERQMSSPVKKQTSHQTVHVEEKMEETEEISLKKGREESQTKFEHSNNSPFKNFHLQPSSSTAGADLSATAETPKGAGSQTSQVSRLGTKRSNTDPDPSTSRTAEVEDESKPSTGAFEMFDKPSESGYASNSRTELPLSPRLMPNRGNSGQSFSGSPQRDRTYNTNHWTSELPKVNVAASEKRYEGTAISRHSPAPSTSNWHETLLRTEGERYSFMLNNTLNVHICYDKITSIRTDALVNPTDGQLTHVNDIARSIAMAAGPQMTNQCQFFLRQNGGPLESTEVIETYACGSLSGRVGHVIHLAMPVYEAANEKSSVNKLLRSYLNCLTHINDNLGLVSVVFPCVGAGSYPQDTCINVFFESLLIHLAERKTSRIKTVKFVVNDIHLGNLAIAMMQAHLERSILEGIDVLMAEALNSYYGNSKFECNQNDINDQLGRQLEVDSPKKLFRGPPVKRPRL